MRYPYQDTGNAHQLEAAHHLVSLPESVRICYVQNVNAVFPPGSCVCWQIHGVCQLIVAAGNRVSFAEIINIDAAGLCFKDYSRSTGLLQELSINSLESGGDK